MFRIMAAVAYAEEAGHLQSDEYVTACCPSIILTRMASSSPARTNHKDHRHKALIAGRRFDVPTPCNNTLSNW